MCRISVLDWPFVTYPKRNNWGRCKGSRVTIFVIFIRLYLEPAPNIYRKTVDVEPVRLPPE